MVRRNLEVAGFIAGLLLVLGLSLYLYEAPRASADEYDAPEAEEPDDDDEDDGDGEPYDVDDPDYDYWLAQQAGSDLDAFGQNQTESERIRENQTESDQGPTDSTEPVIVRVEGAGGSSVPQRDIAETIRAVKEADPDAQVLCVVVA